MSEGPFWGAFTPLPARAPRRSLLPELLGDNFVNGDSTRAARMRNNAGKTIRSTSESGAPGEIRTPDRLVRSQVLYPAELRAHGGGCAVSGRADAGVNRFAAPRAARAEGLPPPPASGPARKLHRLSSQGRQGSAAVGRADLDGGTGHLAVALGVVPVREGRHVRLRSVIASTGDGSLYGAPSLGYLNTYNPQPRPAASRDRGPPGIAGFQPADG